MKVSRVIQDKEELWLLLEVIKKLDEITFIACLIGAYMGARFSELKALKIGEFHKSHVHLGNQIYIGTGRQVLVSDKLRLHLKSFSENRDAKAFLLQKEDGNRLAWLEASRIVKQAADILGLEDIALSSFRKSFGHQLLLRTKDKDLVLYGLGFSKEPNLEKMFQVNEIER